LLKRTALNSGIRKTCIRPETRWYNLYDDECIFYVWNSIVNAMVSNY